MDPDSSSLPAHVVLLRLLRLCWHHRSACLQVLALQAALLTLGLAGLGFTGLGIDYLRATLDPEALAPHWPLGLAPSPSAAPFSVLLLIALAVALFALLRGALAWWAGNRLAVLVHQRIVPDLQTRVFAKLQRLSFRFFDAQDSGAIINRATGDIQAIRTFVETVLIQSFVTLISLVVYTTYMASISWPLTLACLVTLPFLWLACILFSRSVHPEYVQNRKLFDRMILSLAECIQGISVIKGFAREPEMARRFEAANEAVKAQQRRIFWKVSTFSPVIDLLTQFSLTILLIYGGMLTIRAEIPLGAGLIVFAGLLQQFANQVSTTAQIANGVQESLTGARRVFEILDAPLGIASPLHPHVLSVCRGEVSFRRVSFSYTPSNAVLSDVSFTIQAGQCVAIVGETGSGKSALLSLIPRFYDPEHGAVLLDGVDLRQLDVDTLRRHVSVVFQESFLFSDTIAANIAFGRPVASQEEIIAAAKAAQAHDFISEMPLGYDTVIGESGIDLSGGQRQRLAIARALLTQPSVLLLDDPTAAIDPETEHEILTAIENAIAGRTTFIVAHRLSTLRRADLILVLEQGRIVQQGSHQELLRQDGPYRRAALLQMVDDDSRRALSQQPTALAS